MLIPRALPRAINNRPPGHLSGTRVIPRNYARVIATSVGREFAYPRRDREKFARITSHFAYRTGRDRKRFSKF